MMTPPIYSQLVIERPQAEPSHHLWYSAESVPMIQAKINTQFVTIAE
jgi:hypothetical protein